MRRRDEPVARAAALLAAAAAATAAAAGEPPLLRRDAPGAPAGDPTPVPPGVRWACGPQGKCVRSNVGHSSEETCAPGCEPAPPGMRYTCGGFGQCYQNSGSSATLTDCEQVCLAPTPPPHPPPDVSLWACGGEGECVAADIGHSNKVTCEQSCSLPPSGMRFDCGSFGNCYQAPAGVFATLPGCVSACGPTPPPAPPQPPVPPGALWACGADGRCVAANIGHASASKCESTCRPAVSGMRFNCGGFGKCYQKSDGDWGTESACELQCTSTSPPAPPAPAPHTLRPTPVPTPDPTTHHPTPLPTPAPIHSGRTDKHPGGPPTSKTQLRQPMPGKHK